MPLTREPHKVSSSDTDRHLFQVLGSGTGRCSRAEELTARFLSGKNQFFMFSSPCITSYGASRDQRLFYPGSRDPGIVENNPNIRSARRRVSFFVVSKEFQFIPRLYGSIRSQNRREINLHRWSQQSGTETTWDSRNITPFSLMNIFLLRSQRVLSVARHENLRWAPIGI